LESEQSQPMLDGRDRNQILRELMQTYGRDVWNFAFSLARRSDAADDITQDTFIKVYQKLDSYRGDASIKTWILSITRNTTYDYQRSAFVRKVTLMDYIFDLTQGSQASAEDEVMEQSVTDEVWQKVLSLPAKYREILVLYAHHHLTIAEISNLLDTSEGTVKSRLHRARKRMNTLYKAGETNDK
jgi:RNA polymerase sigma-70 factor (ECF subfamily)